MHVKPCKKTAAGGVWAAKRRHGAAFHLQKDGMELHFTCKKAAADCVWAAITRHEAVFGLRKDGTELRLGGRKAAGGGIRAATGVLPRSLQCAKTRSHARKAPCTYTSHAAPKHISMQEKRSAHAIL